MTFPFIFTAFSVQASAGHQGRSVICANTRAHLRHTCRPARALPTRGSFEGRVTAAPPVTSSINQLRYTRAQMLNE